MPFWPVKVSKHNPYIQSCRLPSILAILEESTVTPTSLKGIGAYLCLMYLSGRLESCVSRPVCRTLSIPKATSSAEESAQFVKVLQLLSCLHDGEDGMVGCASFHSYGIL